MVVSFWAFIFSFLFWPEQTFYAMLAGFAIIISALLYVIVEDV